MSVLLRYPKVSTIFTFCHSGDSFKSHSKNEPHKGIKDVTSFENAPVDIALQRQVIESLRSITRWFDAVKKLSPQGNVEETILADGLFRMTEDSFMGNMKRVLDVARERNIRTLAEALPIVEEMRTRNSSIAEGVL